MTRKFKIVSLLLMANIFVIAHGKMKEGLYRIQNLADGLHVTTEGANTAFAKVVGENWQNFGEQRWKLQHAGTGIYNLMPEKHTTNNALSFFRDPSKKYALPERWSLIEVPNGYEIQNQRTGLCLISSGRRREILEGKCDKYLPDRHWKFIPL